jgi:hypothetical protein
MGRALPAKRKKEEWKEEEKEKKLRMPQASLKRGSLFLLVFLS